MCTKLKIHSVVCFEYTNNILKIQLGAIGSFFSNRRKKIFKVEPLYLDRSFDRTLETDGEFPNAYVSCVWMIVGISNRYRVTLSLWATNLYTQCKFLVFEHDERKYFLPTKSGPVHFHQDRFFHEKVDPVHLWNNWPGHFKSGRATLCANWTKATWACLETTFIKFRRFRSYEIGFTFRADSINS